MATQRISYVPNERGRFVRYPYARERSSNPFVEIGRFFYNLIIGIFHFTNLLHQLIITFNNMISSLPFGIRHFVQAIVAFCLPFYTIFQGFAMLFNRIYRVAYPIYRAITIVIRIFTFFIELPIRIITFIPILVQHLLKNLLVVLILIGIFVGLLVLLSNEEQMNLLKSYFHNTTDLLLKQCSKLRFIPIFSLNRYNMTKDILIERNEDLVE